MILTKIGLENFDLSYVRNSHCAFFFSVQRKFKNFLSMREIETVFKKEYQSQNIQF